MYYIPCMVSIAQACKLPTHDDFLITAYKTNPKQGKILPCLPVLKNRQTISAVQKKALQCCNSCRFADAIRLHAKGKQNPRLRQN